MGGSRLSRKAAPLLVHETLILLSTAFFASLGFDKNIAKLGEKMQGESLSKTTIGSGDDLHK